VRNRFSRTPKARPHERPNSTVAAVPPCRSGRWSRLTEIKVEVEDETAARARPRFAWNIGEVSGSLGDLGTFLPHIVGAITVVKMDPTGILTTFGLFYAFTGAFYGVPMAVPPMKAASAAVLIEPMDPAAIAGAGLVIGSVFLILGITGVVSRLARALPGSIAAGLQLGLGLSLAALGIRLIETQIWLGVAISALMLGLMRYQRSPVGPGVSKVEDSGTTPSVGQRPSVTFGPTVPVMHAGIRTEPAVSLPKASSAEPSSRLMPAPLDEPPGARCARESHGL
jgi:Molybdate transporter of MFS superfamily